jgi:adenosylcobyric acid synthase
MSAKPIMIQGTASTVGKSIITAALCRIFNDDGYNVAPFKSQNMALNSFVTKDGGEMGRAQVVQAEAARIEPTVEMNPILLKPTGDKDGQVILNGKVFGNISAFDYHEYKPTLIKYVRESYDGLSKKHDIIIIEGAGSPAEINLRENDLVNMGMAEIADSPVLLVGDIDKGGVFAALAGTLMLLTDDERARVKGVIINKFRGDIELLKPGLKMLEDIIKIPVLGVIPYKNLDIDEEDSVTERFEAKNNKVTICEETDDRLDIVVIKLPHMSNYTDFNPLEKINAISCRYVGVAKDIGNPDLIILPGTKNTLYDTEYIRKMGIDKEIINRNNEGTCIFGICGGFQILGEKIFDPYEVESNKKVENGLGLLKMNTTLEKEKQTRQVKAFCDYGLGLLKNLKGIEVIGYEIHMGVSEPLDDSFYWSNIYEPYTIGDGLSNKAGNVAGSYVHGIFDNPDFTKQFLENVAEMRGKNIIFETIDYMQFKQKKYSELAEHVRENLDMKKIYSIINGLDF